MSKDNGAPVYPMCATPEMTLEEEGAYYVPDLLRDTSYEPRPGQYTAAEEHARPLDKAERRVDEALLLAQVLRASLGDSGGTRAQQTDAVLRIIEKKLGKARTQIDVQRTRSTNLFMAYAELSHVVDD